MANFTEIKGDATHPIPFEERRRVIIHICNDNNGWGRGFVLALNKLSDLPRETYKSSNQKLGEINWCQIPDEYGAITVVNMIAQHDYRPINGRNPIRYWALHECLKKVANIFDSKTYDIHMPKIGCGLAGGHWDEIYYAVNDRLPFHNVYIYTLSNTIEIK